MIMTIMQTAIEIKTAIQRMLPSKSPSIKKKNKNNFQSSSLIKYVEHTQLIQILPFHLLNALELHSDDINSVPENVTALKILQTIQQKFS